MKNQNGKIFDLIIVGGGAAGFYAALQVAERKPLWSIVILEKTTKVLTKVKISGGGRCNVTHHCFDPIELSHHYPRGEKVLKNLFKKYQASDVVAWFKDKGVKLKFEEDGRMFPVTDNSQTIIDCFLSEAHRHNIQIELASLVTEVKLDDGESFSILTQHTRYQAKKVLITTGGNPNRQSYQWIESLGHSILSPKPSLFTFNDSNKKFSDLMGISVPDAEVKIAGTKFSQTGSLLITHWGLSGPVVIKLSAWSAEFLFEKKYEFTTLVNWIGGIKEEELRSELQICREQHRKKSIITNPLFNLPSRLWQRLCELAEIPEDKIWAELPQKNLNKLIESLIRCPFHIKGKTTFKEEFVTCGGVDLKDIDLERMESKKVKNLFFAGEVLNIDGETGGFNFQSAWTTAYIAATAIGENGNKKS